MKASKVVEIALWAFIIFSVAFGAVQIFSGPAEAQLFNCGTSSGCASVNQICDGSNISCTCEHLFGSTWNCVPPGVIPGGGGGGGGQN